MMTQRTVCRITSFLAILALWSAPVAQAGYMFGGDIAQDLSCAACVSLTTEVSGILPGANGGTANGFFAVSGPTTSLKTFAFPDTSDTVATYGIANTFTANQTISNTAPSFIFTDTTASAKSLTIAVDANLAQFRESAGASLSGLVYDLANNRLGIGVNPSQQFTLSSTGALGWDNGSGTADTFFSRVSSGIVDLKNSTNAQRFYLYKTYTDASNYSRLNINSDLQANAFELKVDSAGTGPAMNLYLTANSGIILTSSMRVSGVLGSVTDGVSDIGSVSSVRFQSAYLTTSYNLTGANGQKWVLGRKTELTTIAAAATTTTTITIPANAILEAVLMRVTTVIPTAATMVVTATTSGTILQQGASISVAAGTTDIGTRAWGTNYQGVAAQTITITPNATPIDNTGRVRFDIYYKEPTVATS